MTKRHKVIGFEHHKVATILSYIPKHIREPLIHGLQQQHPEIGNLTFQFEDLIHGDDAGLSILINQLHQHDQSLLAYAMLTASSALQYRINSLLNQAQRQQLAQQTFTISRFNQSQINPSDENSYAPNRHDYEPELTKSHEEHQYQIALDSYDAQQEIILIATRLQQQHQLKLHFPDLLNEFPDEQLIKQINLQLQKACQTAMAQVLNDYSPKTVAIMLCRRLDRQGILNEMLNIEQLNIMSDNELNKFVEQLESLMISKKSS